MFFSNTGHFNPPDGINLHRLHKCSEKIFKNPEQILTLAALLCITEVWTRAWIFFQNLYPVYGKQYRFLLVSHF